jgi:membrane protein insertase Oxa1/YidC/SpoIIIJ
MLNAITPTHVDNLVEGGSTYGFWESLKYMDGIFTDQWLYVANDLGLGMGAGLILTSLGVRCLFIPILMYTQISGIKMKLL